MQYERAFKKVFFSRNMALDVYLVQRVGSVDKALVALPDQA